MKPSRFFLSAGAVLLVIGLLAVGISFIMGGNWDETLSIINMGDISNYYRRNDNTELDSDALIWTEPETTSIFYDFSAEVVTKIDINITNADITISEGDVFTVTIDNIKKDDISCKVNRSGTLIIDNASNNFSLFNIFRRRSFINRGSVLLTVPSGVSFTSIELTSHTGSLISEAELHTEKAVLETESGAISVAGLYSDKTTIKTGTGAVAVAGILHGKTEIKCDSGSVEVAITDSKSNYSYTADSGMGEISVDGTVYSGSSRLTSGKTMADNIRMTCGSGRIKISFE